MDVRFNPYQLIEEELLKEKLIAPKQGMLVHEEKPILVQDESKPILGFDEARESLAMDESSLKDSIQMASMLVPSFEETMEVQVQEKEEPTKVQRGQGRK